MTVTMVIPGLLVALNWPENPEWSRLPVVRAVSVVVGVALICLGLILVVRTISLFVTIGQGTLAPWDATRKLVVYGVYRHVRNPMIGGVFCILLGESLTLGSSALLGWFLLFFLGNLIYIPLIEEPGLQRRFSEAYERYGEHVPRWIPRPKPWVPTE
jgi:protein-S-isoprenylcysteine O-methyltransferase Ste14